MNGGPGNRLGAERAEQFPHLENYTPIISIIIISLLCTISLYVGGAIERTVL